MVLDRELQVLDLAPVPDLWGSTLERAELAAPLELLRRSSTRRAGPLLVAAVVAIAGLVLIASGGDDLVTVVVTSRAMEPTLQAGEAVDVDLSAYGSRMPARGEVVAFRHPAFPDGFWITRVIGLPGDRIQQIDGVVSVNGEVLDEPYAVADTRDGAWIVRAEHLFVMGDNRPIANDSRFTLGQVPIDDVVGEVLVGSVSDRPLEPPAAPAIPA